MIVRQDTDGSLLAVVAAASRALVFLTVEWSGPERLARSAFREAPERLTAKYADLDIAFFWLNEDTEWCQRWLAGIKVPQLGGGYPLGAGSMLWLEVDQPVSHEVGGAGLSAGQIVARSLSLWSTATKGRRCCGPRRHAL
jgi:hypothetical protein